MLLNYEFSAQCFRSLCFLLSFSLWPLYGLPFFDFMQGPVAIILISWNVIFIWETGYWTRAIKRFALFNLLKSLYSDTKILSKYIYMFIYSWVLTFPLEDSSEFGNFVITLIYCSSLFLLVSLNLFFPLSSFSFGHCIFCPSLTYGFWYPFWYLHTS